MKSLTFNDVLLVPKYNNIPSRKNVTTSVMTSNGKLALGIPVMSANMDTITEDKMCIYMAEKGGIGVMHRFMSIESNVRMYKSVRDAACDCFISIGIQESDKERAIALIEAGASKICIDVAHGHCEGVEKTIKWLRSMPHGEAFTIMAGNVATKEAARFLEKAGADIIKVGIGPGSVCSTRIKTGFGVGQITAIQECSNGVKRASIVADGGIKTPGDIVKALAFGADFVMLGGMLAGTAYVPERGRQVFRGMASEEVAIDYNGGLDEWKTAEGVTRALDRKDEFDTDDIIHDIVGGIRSGLTYCGAKNIKEMQLKMEYTEITSNVLAESKPHF